MLALAACGPLASPAPLAPTARAVASPSSTPSLRPQLPARVWVNAPLGANLRADHDRGAASVALLRQGAELTVSGAWPDTKADWYRVSAQDLNGWISAQVVVDAHIQRTGPTDLVTVAVPDGLYGGASPGNANEFLVRSGPQATDPIFLRVRRAPRDADLPVNDPGVLDHSTMVEVWSYTALEQVYQRPDGSAYFVIRVAGASGRYLLEFFDRTTTSTRVQQVLDSMTLN